ncbi:MAG: hypothetical protein U0353_31655 [Sandaracinus sp.]
MSAERGRDTHAAHTASTAHTANTLRTRARGASALVLAASMLAGCGPAARSDDESTLRVARVSPVDRRDRDDDEPPLRGRPPDRDEETALREAMRIAERLRALRFVEPVPVRVQRRDDIVAFVRDGIEDDELEEARIFYVALGLLPEDVDLRALLISVMGEQIAGFYDPHRHTMVVRDDVMEEMTRLVSRGGTILGTPSAMVLVHEYVHALQDQRLGLREDEQHERTIDEANAYAALVEGDATLTMLGIGLAGSGRTLDDLTRTRGLLRAQLGDDVEAGPAGSELASAPAILRAPLMSRYLDGLVFTGALHGAIDRPPPDRPPISGFPAIDAAFADPPRSTEEVLHPERYAAHAPPAPIALPALATMGDEGFSALDEETLGELELSVYLAQGSGHDRDREAAAGWDGDRIRVYHRDARAEPSMAFVWLTRWDDEREALEAEAAAQRVAGTLRTPAGAPSVTRRGRALAITAGLPAASVAEVDAALATLAGTS